MRGGVRLAAVLTLTLSACWDGGEKHPGGGSDDNGGWTLDAFSAMGQPLRSTEFSRPVPPGEHNAANDYVDTGDHEPAADHTPIYSDESCPDWAPVPGTNCKTRTCTSRCTYAGCKTHLPRSRQYSKPPDCGPNTAVAPPHTHTGGTFKTPSAFEVKPGCFSYVTSRTCEWVSPDGVRCQTDYDTRRWDEPSGCSGWPDLGGGKP